MLKSIVFVVIINLTTIYGMEHNYNYNFNHQPPSRLDFDKLSSSVLLDHHKNFLQIKAHSYLLKQAESGYHALKNGLLIIRDLADSKLSLDQKFIDLSNESISNDLFGNKDSIWQSHIAKIKKINKAREYLKNILYAKLNEQNNQHAEARKNISLIKKAIEYTADILAHKYIEKNHSYYYELHKQFIGNNIYSYLFDQIYAGQQEAEHLITTNFVDHYLTSLAETISFDIPKSNKIQDPNAKEDTLADGHLTASEILCLFDFVQQNQAEIGINDNIPIYIIDQLSPDNDLLSNESLQVLYNQLRSFYLSLTVLLIVKQDNEWIPCVINKVLNQIQYLTAHPTNIHLTNNHPLIKLIEVVEGTKNFQKHPENPEGTFTMSNKRLTDYVGEVPLGIQDGN